jgi:hypothetical protein
VLIDNDDGSSTLVPALTIDVQTAAGASLGTVTSDSSGVVPGGTVSVAVGTTIRFTGDLGNGIVAYAEDVTT